MLRAFYDLRYDYSGKPARNLFYLFQRIHLQSDGSQCLCNGLRCKVTLNIILEPIIRNLHNMLFFQIFLRKQ